MVKIPEPKLIDITKIKVHPNNVKEHPESQINNLVQLIKWVGFKDPIVLDSDDTIRAGHGRLLAAKKLNMTELPYVRLEGLTPEQMDLFIYMDNKINDSPWIKENIELILKDIKLETLQLFDVEWDKIRPEEFIEEEPIPELPVEPKSKLGDIYQLGEHRVMCGDSTKDLDKLLGGITVDLLLTDPPYNIADRMSYEFHKSSTNFSSKKLIEAQWDKGFYPDFLNHLNEYMKKDSTVYVFTSHILFGTIHELVEKWSKFNSFLVWCKRNPMPSLAMRYWTFATELIYFATKGKHTFNFIKGQHNLNYILTDKRKESTHPTEKPVSLLTELITHSSNKENLILDPFLGSGSTLIACEQTNRVCYGMELDPAYVDVIVERWQNYTGKQAELLHTTPGTDE